jgi:hypothetical protein
MSYIGAVQPSSAPKSKAPPMPFMVSPVTRCNIGNMAAGNVMESKPGANVPNFGMCQSMQNPVVTANCQMATAAAMGNPMFAPAPCSFPGGPPWSDGSKEVKIGGQAALIDGSKLKCPFGGEITFKQVQNQTVKCS